MVILKRDIWWADLPEAIDSGPGDRRPVVVVQSDHYNRSRIATVVCIAVSSSLGLAKAPGNVVLPAAECGLPKDSVANVSQIISLDRKRLTHRICALSMPLFRKVQRGLRQVLDLD